MSNPIKMLRPMSEYPHGVDESKVIVYHSWMGHLERAVCKFPAYDSKAVGWIWKEEEET